MGELTPIQLFLWIIFLEIASVPIVTFMYTWISNIRMTKSRELIGIVLQAISNTIKEHKNGKKDNEDA